MKLYNTLTRSVQDLEPLAPPNVTMYVCGPTVYDVPHIGHARSAYIFDVLRCYLEYRKLQVTFVRNVTDVDDKIIDKARQEAPGKDLNAACRQVAEKYLASYHETMERLGLGQPTKEPRATEHVVPEMTDFISKLLMQGAAYEAQGDVYFAVRKFPGYGRLSNRTVDELQAGARVEPGEHPGPPSAPAGAGKQDPLDFALWKRAKPGEPSWSSPWGKGRPGWHIECSAMSTKYLGDTFDIHGGGVDLVFPHHENEIAQAQAAGKPFARIWVHNGLLTVKGEKMSKSLGNFLTVEQVLDAYPHPDYLKIFFLKTHYRSPIDYSQAKMDEAKKNWEEFSRFFQHYFQKTPGASGGSDTAQADVFRCKTAFEEAMDEDLNTPKAIAALFDLVNIGHVALESGDELALFRANYVRETLLECGTTLGLFLQGISAAPPQALKRIQSLITEREAARKGKKFARADEIRTMLEREGVFLSDTPNGTFWRRVQ